MKEKEPKLEMDSHYYGSSSLVLLLLLSRFFNIDLYHCHMYTVLFFIVHTHNSERFLLKKQNNYCIRIRTICLCSREEEKNQLDIFYVHQRLRRRRRRRWQRQQQNGTQRKKSTQQEKNVLMLLLELHENGKDRWHIKTIIILQRKQL